MIKTFNEILQEARYSPRKMFYHISHNSFNKFIPKNHFRMDDDSMSGTFLTPSLFMIKKYLTDYLWTRYNKLEYYIYRCFLNKDLNIFNPSDPKDRKKFVDQVRLDPKSFYKNYIIKARNYIPTDLNDLFIQFFSKNDWTDGENPAISNIIHQLNFDGYEVTEHNTVNIFVFNSNYINIADNGPWKTIKAANYDTINKQFNKLQDDIDNRINVDKIRTAPLEDYSDFEKYTKEEMFDVVKMNGDTELEYNDLSIYFNINGKLLMDKVFDDFSDLFLNIKPEEYVEFDNKRFTNYHDFEYYLKQHFQWVQDDGDEYDDL
jgi:hypothetical protein